MADDVTIDDMKMVWKRLEKLEKDAKETARLRDSQDDYDKTVTKNTADDAKEFREGIKKLDARVVTLEKASKGKK